MQRSFSTLLSPQNFSRKTSLRCKPTKKNFFAQQKLATPAFSRETNKVISKHQPGNRFSQLLDLFFPSAPILK